MNLRRGLARVEAAINQAPEWAARMLWGPLPSRPATERDKRLFLMRFYLRILVVWLVGLALSLAIEASTAILIGWGVVIGGTIFSAVGLWVGARREG
jgi:hypothetical protein